MGYTFKIHDTGSNTYKNWEKLKKGLDKDAISTIQDELMDASDELKLGTSIPTPFARMKLFETAFSLVVSNDTKSNKVELDKNTPYHELVSDCLDLLQLLYQNDSKLSFKKYTIKNINQVDNSDISRLKNGNNSKNKLWANVLESYFESSEFDNITELFIIYYNDFPIGGTSPYSLVFTSPNWKRHVRKENLEFPTSTEDYLFDDEAMPLYRRETKFQEYLYKLREVFLKKINENDSKQFLSKYILENFERNKDSFSNTDAWETLTEQNFLHQFEPVSIDGGSYYMKIGNIPLCTVKAEDINNQIRTSDFIIESPFFVGDQRPLALVAGNHDLKYIESTWKDTPINIINDNSSLENKLRNRILPGTNYPYPFVTSYDFLEDKIIDVGYPINSNKFFTGLDKDFTYLLPIKSDFFKFFTFEDLKKSNFLQVVHKESQSVKVTLNIPVKNGNSLRFDKTYSLKNDEDVVDLGSITKARLSIGIYPFYKITDDETFNDYSIHFLKSNLFYKDISLNLHKFNSQSGIELLEISDKKLIRNTSTFSKTSISTNIPLNKQYFDVIEVNVELENNAIKGMILPLFETLKTTDLNKKSLVFGVDFGTTNTHVAYTTDDDKGSVTSIDFGGSDTDMHTVFLNKPTKSIYPEISDFADFYRKEFVPPVINNENEFGFPIRTAIFENDDFTSTNKPILFGNINIGFNYENETEQFNNYVTDLKWALEESSSNNANLATANARLEAFIFQIVWMIKNKLISKRASLRSHITWTYPISMNRRSKNTLKNIWKEALNYYFGNHFDKETFLTEKTESYVPYFSLKETGKVGAGHSFNSGVDTINIDIGGGTTDVCLLQLSKTNENKKSYYYSSSFKFAANDIWGGGLTTGNHQHNGFLLLMEELICTHKALTSKNKEQDITNFQTVLNHSKLSQADKINFLFKNNEIYNFTNAIESNDGLKYLLFIHLSSIIFYISKFVEDLDIDFPKQITFSGNGSKYLNLFGSSEDILDLINGLLNLFKGENNKGKFTVMISKSPKTLTAEGAVIATIEKDIKLEDIKNQNVFQGVENINTIKDLKSSENEIVDFAKSFFDIIQGKACKDLLKDFVIIPYELSEKELLEKLKESYQFASTQVLQNSTDENASIEDVTFFWTLKHFIYELSRKIYHAENN